VTDALPEARFVDTDPLAITADMIAAYETLTGKTLQPAQPERLFIDWLAYQIVLQRIAMNEVGRQCLLAYARYPMLDYIGDLPGVSRLPAQAAGALFSVELARPLPTDLTINGLRVRSSDAAWVFAQTAPITIPAGQPGATALFKATVTGLAGNGLPVGTLATLEGTLPVGVARVVQLSVSYGGSDREDDERLRARIQSAPERFSTAGPAGAYRWHALSAHASIRDAAVVQPEPGRVRVVILTDRGMPDQPILDLVAARLSDDRVRPLTDRVEVAAPIRVPYRLRARVTLLSGVDRATVKAALDRAAAAYVAERRAGLGRDLVPSQIIAALQVSGVHQVILSEPDFTPLDGAQWADANGVELTLAGESADG
jgi:phage-related baseplate assembly protein